MLSLVQPTAEMFQGWEVEFEAKNLVNTSSEFTSYLISSFF